MPPETATMTADRATDRPRLRRRTKADRFDRRTAAWRRRQELITTYREALGLIGGPIGEALQLKLESAAETRIAAEKARADYLADGDVPLDDVVRVEALASRLERQLGITAGPVETTAGHVPLRERIGGARGE